MSKDLTALLYRGIQTTRPLLRHITAAVEKKLEGTGVTIGQRAVLEALLETPGQTAPQITRALQQKRQFTQRMLAELQAGGLVHAQPNPAHARAHLYVLTEAGMAAITAIRDEEAALVAAFVRSTPAEDIEAFARVQTRLNDVFRWESLRERR